MNTWKLLLPRCSVPALIMAMQGVAHAQSTGGGGQVVLKERLPIATSPYWATPLDHIASNIAK
ncbi:hypothetical protein P3T40_007402 [Paraburkholderia sp. EB58]|jgi:hypothetical protein